MDFLVPIDIKNYHDTDTILVIEVVENSKQIRELAKINPNSVCNHLVTNPSGEKIDEYIGLLCRQVESISRFNLPFGKFYFSGDTFEKDLKELFGAKFDTCDMQTVEEVKSLFVKYSDGFLVRL